MGQSCDLIIRGASIMDGTGAPARRGDVGVTGDRIAAVGDLSGCTAQREVQAGSLALAPGFIDSHTHDDRVLLGEPAQMLCKLSQGVTTVVVGNCGISLAPGRMARQPPDPLRLLGDGASWEFDTFAEYVERLRRKPPVVNCVALVGHMSLRVQEMNFDTARAATDAECSRMRDRLAEALRSGAVGLSTGLWYPPSRCAPTQEVLAVAEALREANGLYVTHLRDEADGVIESIEEALAIGRGTDSQVIVSHHKCALPRNFGRSIETLARLDEASQSQRVAFDVYPYAATSTALLPDALEQGLEVQINWSSRHPQATGRMLRDIAHEWSMDERSAARELAPASAIYFSLHEEDVRRIVAHPECMIGSDGLPDDQRPHPRLWGTFPRVLGHYARELGLLSMEMAVRKMTGRTAEVFGLADRGFIREGAFADLVLFDPRTVMDEATFAHPTRPSRGIVRTWVNGELCFSQDQGITGSSAGRLLTRRVS